HKLEESLLKTLAECPPELAGDLVQSGIWLTGGGSLLRGLAKRLQRRTGLTVHSDPDPFYSVSNGISKVTRDTSVYSSLLID
ncbi:MAG: rod shape-determining protein, partial [Bacteroidota bacterium]